MALKFSNEAVLEQLKHGCAHFELVSSPVLSISTSIYSPAKPVVLFGDYSHRFFAKIVPPGLLGRGSPAAIWGAEIYKVQKLKSDGRCLFLALVKGMYGNTLTPKQQIEYADHLRTAVHYFICTEHQKQNPQYEAARKAIVGSVKRYCKRVTNQDHWGGKPELLALSEMCKLPIIVYEQADEEHPNCFTRIQDQEYGMKYGAGEGGRKPVRLLLSGNNHYDLLV